MLVAFAIKVLTLNFTSFSVSELSDNRSKLKNSVCSRIRQSCLHHFRTCLNHLTDSAKYADNTDDGNDVTCLITLVRLGMSGFSCPSAPRMLYFHMTSYTSAQS